MGTGVWIYIAEIVTSEVAMGICLFTLMVMMTLQSMTATYMIHSKMGIDFLFYCLGGLQVVAVLLFASFLKETCGLSTKQKKALYVPIREKGQKEL